MFEEHRKKLAAAAVAAVAVIVVAGAVAATGTLSPRQESEAVVDDAARRLGVEPSELRAALKAALKGRVDAAVQAGRLTQAQGDELKQRINANDVLLFGRGGAPRGHHRHFHVHSLDAAAAYLGMTGEALRTQLMNGRTLAQIAQVRNKPVGGLVDAMVESAQRHLDQAVRDGRLTDAQRDRIVAALRPRITEKVNGTFRPHRHRFGRGFGPAEEREPASF
jgi:hypothetical protein